MKDGGQAYPSHNYLGMTIRQRYKIAAMNMEDGKITDKALFAAWCGSIADAMIAEDERHSKGEE